MTDNLPDEGVLKRIQGLLNLAAKNSQPEEAASAAAKAQELLARYNLSAETVDQARAAADGRREQAAVDGGTYAWQRELWGAVARLNFCLHWVQVYEEWTKVKRVGTGLDRFTTEGYVGKKRHVLVGKIVNTRATAAMAGYLQQAIERKVVERLHGDRYQAQRFSRWAVSLRRGLAKRVIEKLEDRRSELLEQEAVAIREARARAERAGASSETAVSLELLARREADANLDFIYGEGYSARRAAQRAEAARARREAEQAQARWAAEHPEEAARQARERREAADKRWSRQRRQSFKSPDYDVSAFWEGYDAGEDIGLDQQASYATADAGRLGHG